MTFPGEFELMVLLAVLRLGDEAFAVEVLRELDERAGRKVSRGALYKTLERMHDKDLVEWDIEETMPGRGGHPRRRFRVTPSGVAAVRLSQHALRRLSQGLDDVLGGEVR